MNYLHHHVLKIASCLVIYGFSICAAHADDLRTVFLQAKKEDPILAAAKATELATKELKPQALANLLPVLAASASLDLNDSSNQTQNSYNTYSYALSLSQPLISPAFWQTYRQVSAQVKSAIATYQAAEQSLIVRVATQYFAILKAKDDLDFAHAERKAFSRLLEQTDQRFKVGLIAITDVHEAQSKRDNAYAQEIAAENELRDQIEIMGEFTGRELKKYSILKSQIPLHKPSPDNIEHWVKSALEKNFSLLAKVASLDAAKKNIYVKSSGHLPTLDLAGSIAYSKGVPPTAAKTHLKNIGLTVSLPIFSGGSVNALSREAIHNHAIVMYQHEELLREIKSETRQAFRGVLTKISQIAALKQAVVSSKSALEATEAAFQVGTRTIVDVLDAQSDILNAKRNYSKARYDYLLETLKLKQYAGTLNVYDLYAINEFFQS